MNAVVSGATMIPANMPTGRKSPKTSATIQAVPTKAPTERASGSRKNRGSAPRKMPPSDLPKTRIPSIARYERTNESDIPERGMNAS